MVAERKLTDGYAYHYEGSDWKGASAEDWDLEMVVPSEAEQGDFVGTRSIDGVRCNVFRVGEGFFAQIKLEG